MRAIGEAITRLGSGQMDETVSLRDLLAQLEASLERDGIDVLRPGWKMGNLAAPRMLEVGAALSRMRGLMASQLPPAL